MRIFLGFIEDQQNSRVLDIIKRKILLTFTVFSLRSQ